MDKPHGADPILQFGILCLFCIHCHFIYLDLQFLFMCDHRRRSCRGCCVALLVEQVQSLLQLAKKCPKIPVYLSAVFILSYSKNTAEKNKKTAQDSSVIYWDTL